MFPTQENLPGYWENKNGSIIKLLSPAFCMKQMSNVDKVLKISLHNSNKNQPSAWYFPANIQDIWWVVCWAGVWFATGLTPAWSNQTSAESHTNWTLSQHYATIVITEILPRYIIIGCKGTSPGRGFSNFLALENAQSDLAISVQPSEENISTICSPVCRMPCLTATAHSLDWCLDCLSYIRMSPYGGLR